jgi:hypothetical protein
MSRTLEKVLYTGKAHTTGGRNGESRSSDGRLDIKLSSPDTTGGGANPEQLFAAGWSAHARFERRVRPIHDWLRSWIDNPDLGCGTSGPPRDAR